MLLAPRGPAAAPRLAAAAGLVAAALVVLVRLPAPPAPIPPLLADDGLARFGTLVACLSALAVLGFGTARREGPALIAIVALGAAALAGAVHVTSLLLGLEIASLALVGLVVLPLTPKSLEAGYKYLLPGAAGSAALLMGAGLAYAGTGRLDLAAFHGSGSMAALATALLLAGLAFKLSLVPFHLWAPDLYEGAPPATAALAGSAAKAAVVIAILRLDAIVPAQPLWHQGLALLAIASVLLGNLAALRQPSLVRVIGYSSVAHSGYIAAMLSCGIGAAPAALLFYIAAYLPALIAALLVAASLGEAATITSLRGLAWRSPLAGATLALALASLAGLPVAAGFLAKIFLVGTLVGAEAWPLLAAVVIASGLGLFVYFRYFIVLFARDGCVVLHSPPPARAVMAVCTAALLVFGLYPGPLFGWLVLATR
ncbi:MAG: NADH-quinone oxidoreductase subunit N [Alphaproteobacteria bacterium]|nr:MAG: NADH-quinone oxidoreductase subunit N [Alphaproteobacteria bacterium]